jgi:pyrimidine operon attenuation protein / uracil phosphoribosyltransferase
MTKFQLPDAQALYTQLLGGVRPWVGPTTALVGIWSGGAWLAEQLQRDLGLAGEIGVISSALHRDDFSKRGMSSSDATRLPFAVDGRSILLIDDVLFTGRTTRAVINELFDFGRPASVQLAVLVDRGGRELPIEPVFAATRIALNPASRICLVRDEAGRFGFEFDAGVATA